MTAWTRDSADLCFISPELRQLSLVDKAFNGSAAAQFDIATFYLGGSKGFNKEPVKAFYWLTQSTYGGDVRALNQLGVCYVEGCGVLKNETVGYDLIKQAADFGDVTAMVNVALLAYNGCGTSTNIALAVDMLHKAAEMGNGHAANYLGQLYLNGWGVHQDGTLAFQYFTRAADVGVAQANGGLAQCHEEGIGTETDLQIARKYWITASMSGDVVAQRCLGERLLAGIDGFEVDLEKARRYFVRAADGGDAQAQYLLSTCYDKGIGGPQDKLEREKWLMKAAEQRHPEAIAELGVILQDQAKFEKEFTDMMVRNGIAEAEATEITSTLASTNSKKLTKRRSFVHRLFHKNKVSAETQSGDAAH